MISNKDVNMSSLQHCSKIAVLFALTIILIHIVAAKTNLEKDGSSSNQQISNDSVTEFNGNSEEQIIDNNGTVPSSETDLDDAEVDKDIDGRINKKAGNYINYIHLWTQGHNNGEEFEDLNVDNNSTLQSSSFVAGANTFIFIHGFLLQADKNWVPKFKNKILELGNYNVISVNWQSGTNLTWEDYNTTRDHVPVVGAAIGKLVEALHELKQLDGDKTHIIGHCMGAHVAGYVGQNGTINIARITGLDPARPFYGDTTNNKRLSKGDAVYVDIIHSNSCNNLNNNWFDCFGIREAIGDTDFFPNGGDYQPACDKKSNHHRPKQFACDHWMAVDYFLESLEYSAQSTNFLARTAKNYHDYVSGNVTCGPIPQYMGYYATINGLGKYYVNTTHYPPFAVLDQECPSQLSYHLSVVSSYSATTVIISMIITMFAPPIFTLFNYVRKNYSVTSKLSSPQKTYSHNGNTYQDLDRPSSLGLNARQLSSNARVTDVPVNHNFQLQRYMEYSGENNPSVNGTSSMDMLSARNGSENSQENGQLEQFFDLPHTI